MIEPTYLPPRVASGAGRHAVTYETEGVEFAFERVRTERRSGEQTAELTVWDTFTGVEVHSGARVNLTSTRARTELANALARQAKHAAWPELVEGAFAIARKAMRTREPAILLRDAERRESRFMTEPLLTDAGATVLFGDGGTGKSLLALAAAVDLHNGTGGILGLTPARPRNVLFLDWEWDPAVHRDRMEAMLGGTPPPDLAYLRCEASLADESERILAEVRARGTEALVIDSAAWAAGAEPEKSESATGFYLALRAIGLPAIVTAHTPKLGDTTKPFGSVFWHNGARLTWQLVGEQGSDSLTRIGLMNRKNNDGRPLPPLGWELDGLTFRRIHAASIAAVSDRMPIRERATALLVAGARTYAEIADEIGEDAKSVRVVIDREIKRGDASRFVKLPGEDNVYRIGLRAREAAA